MAGPSQEKEEKELEEAWWHTSTPQRAHSQLSSWNMIWLMSEGDQEFRLDSSDARPSGDGRLIHVLKYDVTFCLPSAALRGLFMSAA